MLKTDFNNYIEFAEKIKKVQNSEQMMDILEERTGMWIDNLQTDIMPMPSGDIPLAIAALIVLTNALKESYPEEAKIAEVIAKNTGYSTMKSTVNTDMTEAAARTYRDVMLENLKK